MQKRNVPKTHQKNPEGRYRLFGLKKKKVERVGRGAIYGRKIKLRADFQRKRKLGGKDGPLRHINWIHSQGVGVNRRGRAREQS